jgi:hypothetical protein
MHFMACPALLIAFTQLAAFAQLAAFYPTCLEAGFDP